MSAADTLWALFFYFGLASFATGFWIGHLARERSQRN